MVLNAFLVGMLVVLHRMILPSHHLHSVFPSDECHQSYGWRLWLYFSVSYPTIFILVFKDVLVTLFCKIGNHKNFWKVYSSCYLMLTRLPSKKVLIGNTFLQIVFLISMKIRYAGYPSSFLYFFIIRYFSYVRLSNQKYLSFIFIEYSSWSGRI